MEARGVRGVRMRGAAIWSNSFCCERIGSFLKLRSQCRSTRHVLVSVSAAAAASASATYPDSADEASLSPLWWLRSTLALRDGGGGGGDDDDVPVDGGSLLNGDGDPSPPPPPPPTSNNDSDPARTHLPAKSR